MVNINHQNLDNLSLSIILFVKFPTNLICSDPLLYVLVQITLVQNSKVHKSKTKIRAKNLKITKNKLI